MVRARSLALPPPALVWPPARTGACQNRRVAEPRRTPSRLAALLAGLAVALSGCGNSRTHVPDPSVPVVPATFHRLTFPRQGLALSAPTNWIVSQSKPPLVSIVSSGDAVVALWRFPRSAAVPLGDGALKQALSALLHLSHRRDPALQVIRSKAMSFDRVPAVEVDDFQHIGGQIRRVRSLHLFVAGAEVVLEQYAPPNEFHAVDHEAFSPIRRSLRLLSRG